MKPPPYRPGLGDLIETFTPSRSNIAAGFILALLIMGAGLGVIAFLVLQAATTDDLPLAAKKGMSWSVIVIGSMAALFVVVWGAGVFRYAWRLRRRRVSIYDEGFVYEDERKATEVPWSTVLFCNRTMTLERLPILHWPASLLLPKQQSDSYLVMTISRGSYAFDANSVKDIERLGQLLLEQSKGRGWYQEVTTDDREAQSVTTVAHTPEGVVPVPEASTTPSRWLNALLWVAGLLFVVSFIGGFYQLASKHAEQAEKDAHRQQIEERRREAEIMKLNKQFKGKKLVLRDGKLVVE